MAVTQIIDKVTQLEVYSSATDFVTIAKASIKLRLDANIVWLYDNSMSAQVNSTGEPQNYLLDYSIINPPSTASANDLFNAIITMLQTGTTGGDATAANQVIQIEQLEVGSGEPSLFKQADDSTVFIQNTYNPGTGQMEDMSISKILDLILGYQYSSQTGQGAAGLLYEIKPILSNIENRNKFQNLILKDFTNTGTITDIMDDVQTFINANMTMAYVECQYIKEAVGYSAILTYSIDL